MQDPELSLASSAAIDENDVDDVVKHGSSVDIMRSLASHEDTFANASVAAANACRI